MEQIYTLIIGLIFIILSVYFWLKSQTEGWQVIPAKIIYLYTNDKLSECSIDVEYMSDGKTYKKTIETNVSNCGANRVGETIYLYTNARNEISVYVVSWEWLSFLVGGCGILLCAQLLYAVPLFITLCFV